MRYAILVVFCCVARILPAAAGSLSPPDMDVAGPCHQIHDKAFVRAPDGTITTLVEPHKCATQLAGINSAGTATGYFYGARDNPTPFLLSADGSITGIKLQSPAEALAINKSGATTGSVKGGEGFVRDAQGDVSYIVLDGLVYGNSINEKGDVAGEDYVNGQESHAFFRWADGKTVTFDGADNVKVTSASGINAKRQIVGSYLDPNTPVYHGFLRNSDGTMIELDVPSGDDTQPAAINDSGTVTGIYANGSFYQGFVRSPDGTFTTFSVAGYNNTVPVCINKAGYIAGNVSTFTVERGFVRAPDGAITLFDAPVTRRRHATVVTGMNDNGEIVGWYRK